MMQLARHPSSAHAAAKDSRSSNGWLCSVHADSWPMRRQVKELQCVHQCLLCCRGLPCCRH